MDGLAGLCKRVVVVFVAGLAFGLPASAQIVLTDSSSDAYYSGAIRAGGAVSLHKDAKVIGDVHGHQRVLVQHGAVIEGDVSSARDVHLQGTVSGSVEESAPARPLPVLFTEEEARALADRVFEHDVELVDETIDDVIFAAGKVRLGGSIGGVGTVIALGEIDLSDVESGDGPGSMAFGSRISLISFKHVKIGQHRVLRGALFAAFDVSLEKGALLRGTAVALRRVDLKDGARVEFLDPDSSPPVISDLAPADGGFAAADARIAVTFADDVSGIDPASAVLALDAVVRTSEAAVGVGGLSFDPPQPLTDGSHTVNVSVRDFSGKEAAVSWSFSVDLARPAVGVIAPHGRTVGETAPEVSIVYGDGGSGIDVSTLRLDLDGADSGAVCDAGPDGATCTLPLLTSGGHRLDVQIHDLAGNAAATRQEFTFIRDLDPPVLAIVSPAGGDLLARRIARVEGTASDESNLTVTVNGLTAGLSGGAFAISLNLHEGPNDLRVIAVDEAGRSAEAVVSVDVDSLPPTLVVESPRSGAISNQPSARIAGSVDDAGGAARVVVAGEVVPVFGGVFAHDLALSEGTQMVRVRAVDLAGNERAVDLELTRYTLPVVTIESPPDLAYLSSSTVEVRGSVSDQDATVVVNGVPATVSGDGFVAAGIPLIEGGNVLTATITSPLGRAGSDSVNVVRDLTPPRLAVHHPRDGAVLAEAQVAVAGMVNDIVTGTVNASQAAVSVNGVAAEVANRSFFVEGVPLAVGDNLLTVTATDSSGNVGSTQVRVRRHAAAVPRVVVVSGDRQAAMAGVTLPDPLVVELRDAVGLPAAGRTVLFKVVGSDGSLDGGDRQRAVVTGADGRAETRFTLGTRVGVGNQVVEVVASQFVGAVLTASAQPGPPAAIVVDAGGQQLGTAGQALPRPLVATVIDAGHNRLAGVPVRFRVAQGTGRFENGQPEIAVDTDSDGRAIVPFVLGPDETREADVVEALLPGGEGGPKATFVSYGRAAGEPSLTALTGVVLDNSNVPVPGVTLRILGTSITTQSDAKGLFRIQPAPVGTVKLVVDGSTATRPGPWPDLEFVMTTIAGRDNDIGMPIFLLPLDLDNAIVVDETRGGIVTLPAVPGFALDVAPGSVTFPGGGKSGIVSVTSVHSDKVPMVPNFGQQPRIIVTIQPAGARFEPPAALTMPNLESLPPGMVTELYSFDHDLGHFVSIGPATVSEDGLAIVSNPGVGILKAGWHCGGNPAAAGTPADCGPCEICDGSVCVPGCSVASTASFADRSQGGLGRIFAAQCTCDDGDECTINDRCDGSGGCIGDPVQVTGITGSCVGAIGQSLSFTAAANAPDRVTWTAAGGAPPSGKGGSFSTTYSAAGDYTVVAACKASSQSKRITADVDCSTITPVLKEPEVAGTTTNFGAVGPGRRRVAKYKGCVGGGRWCFALEEYLEEHSFVVNNQGRTDVPSASAPIVTPATCTRIIADLTPPGPGASNGPPRGTYWSQAFTTAHERAHVANVKALITDKVFADLQAFVRNPSRCTDCKTAVPTAVFNAEMNRLFNLHVRAMLPTEEIRAHGVSNPMYATLISAIRARARSAPASEGWPAGCQ